MLRKADKCCGTTFIVVLFVLATSSCTHRESTPNVDGHFQKALKFYSDNRLKDALIAANDAIELNPSDSSFFHLRGKINYELHNFEKAIEDFTETVKLKPDDASAYGNRGWCYRSIGRVDLAVQDWQTCNRLFSLPVSDSSTDSRSKLTNKRTKINRTTQRLSRARKS